MDLTTRPKRACRSREWTHFPPFQAQFGWMLTKRLTKALLASKVRCCLMVCASIFGRSPSFSSVQSAFGVKSSSHRGVADSQ